MCCIVQRVSNAILYLMEIAGCSSVNYIDDLGESDTPDNAFQAFEYFGSLLAKIEILESSSKATPPSHIIVFLDIELNLINYSDTSH